jgi:hypothetical protein
MKFGNTEIGALMHIIRDRQDLLGGMSAGLVIKLAIAKPGTAWGWIQAAAIGIGAAYLGTDWVVDTFHAPAKLAAGCLVIVGDVAVTALQRFAAKKAQQAGE